MTNVTTLKNLVITLYGVSISNLVGSNTRCLTNFLVVFHSGKCTIRFVVVEEVMSVEPSEP